MLTLAHLSDLHMAVEPCGSQLLSKRGLGYINWLRKRKNIHRPEVLDALVRDLKAQTFDHVAVTGDLVNFSLPDEYARARDWLATLGGPRDVTTMPGNHDVYVHGVEPMPAQFWGDYMRGDDGLERFPFVRRRADVALIALSTAVSTGPFMATGRLGERQLARFAEALEQTRGSFRTVLIHHPPLSPARRFFRRLIDGADLRRVLAATGAELLLHGHDHRRSLVWLQGTGNRKIPAVGVPSASANAKHANEDPAGYNIFRIERSSDNWRCETVSYQRGVDGTIRECARFRIY
jgi:3',5'-cyclic AMP phosphodiesterase CpdA